MSAATEYAPSVAIAAATRPSLSAVTALSPGERERGRDARLPLATVTVLHRPHSPAPVRLTRRGVLVLGAAVLAVGAALVWIAAASAPSAAGSAGTAGGSGVHSVAVAPGDTLWSIAGRIAPDRDPRAEVTVLQRRNHLHGVDLTPGQRLLVP